MITLHVCFTYGPFLLALPFACGAGASFLLTPYIVLFCLMQVHLIPPVPVLLFMETRGHGREKTQFLPPMTMEIVAKSSFVAWRGRKAILRNLHQHDLPVDIYIHGFYRRGALPLFEECEASTARAQDECSAHYLAPVSRDLFTLAFCLHYGFHFTHQSLVYHDSLHSTLSHC